MRKVGLISEIESHEELRGTPGVYFMCCSICEHPLYIGQTDDIYVRVRNHTFFPPYCVVDIVIGEMLNSTGKNEWNTLCEHLKGVQEMSREQIGARVSLNVAVIQNEPDQIKEEERLFERYPESFGNNEPTWVSSRNFNVSEYRVRRRRSLKKKRSVR